MANSRTFLNRDVLKPETVAAIEAMGELASQLADRWAGGWPKQTRKLEREGRLLQAIQSQLDDERRVRDFEAQNPWQGGLEARELAGTPLSNRPPD